MLSDADRAAAARLLSEAARSRVPIPPLTERWPQLDQADAYAVQRIVIDERLAGGARRTGWKVGLTSEAMQRQLGVDQPDFGPLLDDMAIVDGARCPVDDLISPRVEGEIAFVLGSDLAGDALTVADVGAAVARVVPALEIIDSRVADWRIQLADTIADRASSARYVLGGPGCAFADCDLAGAELRLLVDGAEVGRGQGAAVLGHPAQAVAWLAATLAPYGEALRAGDVVLAGALSAAVPVHAGSEVRADFGPPLGTAVVHFAAQAGT